MRMRRTTQPLPCPTVNAHNGLFPRDGDQRSKLLAGASKSFLCVRAVHIIHNLCSHVLVDRGGDGFSLARHTPQSQGKRGLVTLHTASCSRGMQ